ncbi:unnamed protein product [Mesocestoides corti]|uniref:HYPK_UBA domain-containing protein n=1 Tax=Mesocestoides corti TaxID=53468 RepID=A0A0R3U733_MESCO|nr:unnamed protein product [Mesocestoides corti]
MTDTDSTPEEKSKKPTTHDEKNAADLEKMTDVFEETEVSAGMTDALKKVTGGEKQSSVPTERAPRIKIKAEDVDIIVQEFEISRAAAEKKLKEFHSDLRQALSALCK